MNPLAGQRWASDNEPELGLGLIHSAEGRMVEVLFPATSTLRTYAWPGAPLHRAGFAPGDVIRRNSGPDFIITHVEETDGLRVYHAGETAIPEQELADNMAIQKPLQRLLAGRVDDDAAYRLRLETLYRQQRICMSPVRGFTGARIGLIPHQIYIAAEVAGRPLPRVLLADEVGLGKTIEACLIMHRLQLTGRADRVLILVPDALVHQWFVELLRRFHLLFSIFDEERCVAIEGDAHDNPFHDSQLILAPLSLLAGDPLRAAQAAAAGWDLLIVDEAHHLEWHPEAPGAAWEAVAAIAACTPGLLLLTATPQQLGTDGHFARLRLLDPARYPDMDRFMKESTGYERTAAALERILASKKISAADTRYFSSLSPLAAAHTAALSRGEESARGLLADALLDSFGTGRVMFRNTRRVLSGFPARVPHLVPMEQAGAPARVRWLAALLKSLPDARFLVICCSRELAESVSAGLQAEINLKCGLFHEGLTLLQRDRQAAWFAEEDGARVLLCSEIGSEGRNFQFAHHLVLYDLPQEPGLLEQRIGRLDRIGQACDIHIHVPFVPGTEEEVLARWYHEGLDALRACQAAAGEASLLVAEEFAAAMSAPALLPVLLTKTRAVMEELRARMAAGWDRLLEHQSCRAGTAEALITAIRAADADEKTEAFFIRLLEHNGLTIEEHGQRTWLLTSEDGGALPGLRDGVMHATFDRDRALVREDLTFLTVDHPALRAAMDQLLTSPRGNATCGAWPGGGGYLLETIYVAECPAPPALHADRFLPPMPVRIAIDHRGEDWTAEKALLTARLNPADIRTVLGTPGMRDNLTRLRDRTLALATAKMQKLVATATTTMHQSLGAEIERLSDLASRNDHVHASEAQALIRTRADLAAAFSRTRLRLDAVRLVVRSA